MKRILTLSLALFFLVGTTTSYAVVSVHDHIKDELSAPAPEFLKGFDREEILQLTPKVYRERTGKALSLQEIASLKKYQEELKAALPPNKEPELDKTIYIILAVIGLGFLGIGLNSNWEGNEWIYALLMIAVGYVGAIVCFILPLVGYVLQLIYSLRLMKRFYK